MTRGRSFGDALELLNAGARVTRAGWNGVGQFVYLVPPALSLAQTGAAKAHFGGGAKGRFRERGGSAERLRRAVLLA
ncbi:MW1434 family type I TA system toxin [Burkholderia lata]|uniref:Thoeris anti-defense Tad2 family protein n=1 Tax=Burkholderia lata (strain ATCC 17760 / DSM 23089 / LMG 22485 / NCIMB 9086 / R18194 / 383) TaxID=482957 RepID=UPI00399A6F3D